MWNLWETELLKEAGPWGVGLEALWGNPASCLRAGSRVQVSDWLPAVAAALME